MKKVEGIYPNPENNIDVYLHKAYSIPDRCDKKCKKIALKLNQYGFYGWFILIYGLVTNVQNVTTNVIWVRYFGRLHLGSIRGPVK